jgi:CDP-diacylglycerol--glycerol-3-phosphate 3-phosphatidyltransferase
MVFDWLKNFLEKMDHYRDEFLFLFIKPFWPRKITPNQITYVRIAVGLVLFVLLFFFNIENKSLIVWLFILGVITDLFDGSVARGLGKVTEFGAMLDPTADRILILPIAIYSLYKFHRWLLLALLITEIINAIFSMFYKSKEIYMESNIYGKTKMVLMCIVFGAILIVWPNRPPEIFLEALWISLIFSYLSMLARIMELNEKGLVKNRIITKEIIKK